MGIEFIPKLLGAGGRCGATGSYVPPSEGHYVPVDSTADTMRALRIEETTLTLMKLENNSLRNLPIQHEPDMASGVLGVDASGAVTIMATDQSNVVRVDNGHTCSEYQLQYENVLGSDQRW